MKKIILTTTMISLLFLSNSCSEIKKREDPKQLITSILAKNLNETYINERSNLILESINREDANAVWYSIEELENYIHYAKCEAEKSNIKINGMRLYLGVYPNDTITYKEKAGLTTIFISPTKKRVANAVSGTQSRSSQEENVDVLEVQPLNYGNMGNPPKMLYGIQ